MIEELFSFDKTEEKQLFTFVQNKQKQIIK
jgi:hypothetical protein